MTSPVNALMEFEALMTGVAKVDRAGRGQVRVTGADAQTFLQSLLSQDLGPLTAGQGAHALLLVPQGKLDRELRVLVHGSDDLSLDCEAGTAADTIASLNRFKIRVDVTLRDVSAERSMVSVRGPLAVATIADTFGVTVPEPNHAFVQDGALSFVRADWPGNPGVDILGPVDDVRRAWDALAVLAAHEAAFERLRIVCGIPRDGVDIDASTIPQEAYLDRDAISFTKGCFLGQELVCRIDSRGHVNRLLRIVTVPDVVMPGAVVRAGGSEVGAVTSVAPTGDGSVALATLRREVEPGATVALAWDGGQADGVVSEVPEA